jgi:hypothetical protein
MTPFPGGPGAGPTGGSLTAAIGRRKMAWVLRGIAAAVLFLTVVALSGRFPGGSPDSRHTSRTAGTGVGLT